MSQTTHEANDHGSHASIVKGKRASFANNISFDGARGAFGMRHSFLYFVGTHSPNFCTQISRPPAYHVRISSKGSATAVYSHVIRPYWSSGVLEYCCQAGLWQTRVCFVSLWRLSKHDVFSRDTPPLVKWRPSIWGSGHCCQAVLWHTKVCCVSLWKPSSHDVSSRDTPLLVKWRPWIWGPGHYCQAGLWQTKFCFVYGYGNRLTMTCLLGWSWSPARTSWSAADIPWWCIPRFGCSQCAGWSDREKCWTPVHMPQDMFPMRRVGLCEEWPNNHCEKAVHMPRLGFESGEGRGSGEEGRVGGRLGGWQGIGKGLGAGGYCIGIWPYWTHNDLNYAIPSRRIILVLINYCWLCSKTGQLYIIPFWDNKAIDRGTCLRASNIFVM